MELMLELDMKKRQSISSKATCRQSLDKFEVMPVDYQFRKFAHLALYALAEEKQRSKALSFLRLQEKPWEGYIQLPTPSPKRSPPHPTPKGH